MAASGRGHLPLTPRAITPRHMFHGRREMKRNSLIFGAVRLWPALGDGEAAATHRQVERQGRTMSRAAATRSGANSRAIASSMRA